MVLSADTFEAFLKNKSCSFTLLKSLFVLVCVVVPLQLYDTVGVNR